MIRKKILSKNNLFNY